MQDWKIRKKILFIIIISFVLVFVIITWDLFKEDKYNKRNLVILENNIREDYDQLLKNQIFTVVSMIDNLKNQYEDEHLSEEEIKNKIADTIRNLRYGDTGYYWIDTSDGTNVVLYGSDSEGINRYDLTDDTGKYIVKETIEKAKAGGGFTDYYFPKVGEKEPQPKRAYSAYYESFDWIIGTGIYMDSIGNIITNKITEEKELLRKHVVEHMIIIGGLFIFIIIANMLITKSLIDPMLFASMYAHDVSQSKFNTVIPRNFLKRKDEIGVLICSLHEMNLSIMKNMKEKEDSNIKLNKDNDFLNIILKSIGDGIVVLDSDCKVQIINEAVSNQFHIKPCDILGNDFNVVFNFKDINKRVMDKNIEDNRKREYFLCSNDIELFVEGSFWRIVNENKKSDGHVYVFQNINERLLKNQEIQYLNYHDQLTGLHNRRFFEIKFNELLDNKYFPLGLVVADLNALKLLNDSLGHLIGDELIATFSDVLKKEFSDAETIARIGGDEFAILVPNIEEKVLSKRLTDIKLELAKHQIRNFPISAAFGCAVHTSSMISFAETFKEADEKMYKDKMIDNSIVKNRILASIVQRYFELVPVKKKEVYESIGLAKKFGVILKLDQSMIKRMGKAALVYDIGNVLMEYDYFSQNRKLTEKEKEEIQTHPASAFHILKNIIDYIDVAEIVLCHHENVDGTGYPRGLEGKQIPFESKILSLVTDYCAMGSQRAYRPTLTKKEAMCEIEKNIGLRYDQELSFSFLKMLGSMDEKL